MKKKRSTFRRGSSPALPPSLLMSIPAAAHALGISRMSAWRMTVARTLPTVMLGYRRMVRRVDVERLAARGTPSPKAPRPTDTLP